MVNESEASVGLRRAVLIVALLNLAYFGVEFAVATAIGSVSLFADSVDFLEDASTNLLILLGLGWTARARARLGYGLAALLLAPSVAVLWTAVSKLQAPVPPEPAPLAAAAIGALVVNTVCAVLLSRHRRTGGSLSRAAFLSARNDAAANLLILGAAAVTALLWRSAWPDLIVGLLIAALNLGAAKEVVEAARKEARAQP
jgi:Co/Zn/Cd efflux system component